MIKGNKYVYVSLWIPAGIEFLVNKLVNIRKLK